MATFSKRFLSGSTNGRGIKVAATATPGTLIHTAVAGMTNMDEVWLYCYNSHNATVYLTIEFGGTTAPDDNISAGIPAKQGLFKAIPGFPINNGLDIRAFCDVANVLVITGFVNRIEP